MNAQHPALESIQRMQDRHLLGLGFDAAFSAGRLGSYMSALERNGFASYGMTVIAKAKMSPSKDPLKGGRK